MPPYPRGKAMSEWKEDIISDLFAEEEGAHHFKYKLVFRPNQLPELHLQFEHEVLSQLEVDYIVSVLQARLFTYTFSSSSEDGKVWIYKPSPE